MPLSLSRQVGCIPPGFQWYRPHYTAYRLFFAATRFHELYIWQIFWLFSWKALTFLPCAIEVKFFQWRHILPAQSSKSLIKKRECLSICLFGKRVNAIQIHQISPADISQHPCVCFSFGSSRKAFKIRLYHLLLIISPLHGLRSIVSTNCRTSTQFLSAYAVPLLCSSQFARSNNSASRIRRCILGGSPAQSASTNS